MTIIWIVSMFIFATSVYRSPHPLSSVAMAMTSTAGWLYSLKYRGELGVVHRLAVLVSLTACVGLIALGA